MCVLQDIYNYDPWNTMLKLVNVIPLEIVHMVKQYLLSD